MANLQVGANTSQAVGAFDALTASVLRTRTAFEGLQQQLNGVTSASVSLSTSLRTNVVGAFESLKATFSTLYSWVSKLYGGLELVFNSLLREVDKIQGFNAVMSVMVKSTTAVHEQFQFLRRSADVLGVQFDALSSNYAKLVAAIPEGNRQLDIAQRVFNGVAMAARTLHASNQDTQLMFYAVTQIASKGVVSMEELRRQLGEKLPGALQIAARALNTDTGTLEATIRKGVVNSAKFLDFFADELIRTFSESSKIASTSLSAAINRLTNVWVDFVKEVLDSGAAKSIIGVFDALREKLSDPHVIGQFGSVIKYVADQVTGFIKALTAEDVRTGFDSFARLVQGLTNVLGLLIRGLTWVIEHAAAVGAVVGALKGASTGAALGSVIPGVGTGAGAAVGAAIGLVGGGALGYSIQSSGVKLGNPSVSGAVGSSNQLLLTEDQMLNPAKYMQQNWQNYIKTLITDLYKLSTTDVPGLMTPEMSTKNVAIAILKGWSDPRYKTLQDRQQGLISYSQTGSFLGPTGHLADVLGGKPDKRAIEEEAAAMWRGAGFTSTFIKEWDAQARAYEKNKMTIDELEQAQARLLSRQPFMIEYLRQEKIARAEAVRAEAKQFLSTVDELDSLNKFIRLNREAIDLMKARGILLTMSAEKQYVARGLEQFDTAAEAQRARATSPEVLAIMNQRIDQARVERANALREEYAIQTDAMTGLKAAAQTYFDTLNNGAKQAADAFGRMTSTMQGMWEQFVTTGKIQLSDFVKMIQLELAKITWNKYIGPLAGNAAMSILGLFGLERGGVMTSAGPMPLKAYSYGGVATGPQVAVYGEGRQSEAYVPLPDGRSIPVSMRGDRGGDSIVVNQTNYFGSNVSRAEIATGMLATKNATVAEIRDMMNRRRR